MERKIIDHQLNTMGIDPDTGKVDASILSGSKSTSQMNREDIFFKFLEAMAHSPRYRNQVPYDEFVNEIRKQPKWKPEEMTEKAFGNYMRKYEDQSYFIVVNDIISLTNYNVSNPNHRT